MEDKNFERTVAQFVVELTTSIVAENKKVLSSKVIRFRANLKQ